MSAQFNTQYIDSTSRGAPCPIWLRYAEHNPIVRSFSELEDAAMVTWQNVTDSGEILSYGVVDKTALRELMCQRAEVGKEALEEFEDWLRSHERLAARTARDIRSTIWAALCDNEGYPELSIIDSNRTIRYRHRLVLALERLTRFLVSEECESEDRNWAASFRGRLGLSNYRPRRRRRKGENGRRRLAGAQYLELLETLESHQIWLLRNTPWAWPALHLTLACGLSISQVVRLESDDIENALSSFDDGDPLARVLLYPPDSGRHIVVFMAEEPLRLLTSNYGWWSTVADLIAPGSPESNRHRRAAELVGAEVARICKFAGVRHSRYTVRDANRYATEALETYLRDRGVDPRLATGRSQATGRY